MPTTNLSAQPAHVPAIDRTELVPDNYSPGKAVPWWTKLGSKLVLARLPIPYSLWRKLGLFKHGRSDSLWSREQKFATECNELARAKLGRQAKTILELGPGDSFVGAIVSSAMGAEKISIVDVGDFATVEVERYQGLVERLDQIVGGFANRIDLSSRNALLESINATYFTNGLKDLAKFEAESIELSFSLKVMEHVRRNEFASLISELGRVSSPNAVQRHVVDLHDHMGCGLNNLRFSVGFWEHPIVSRSGFYTNRWRFSQIVQMAQSAGFEVSVPHAFVWPTIPIDRSKMHPQFQEFSDKDLEVCMFDMMLNKRSQPL